MTRDDILKNIAETGYNVGFGAKKHFATYDIVIKTPGLISLFSLAFGIYALVFDALSAKFLSASFLVLGIIGLYISFYDEKKDTYERVGVELTQLFNELRRLYGRTKICPDDQLEQCIQEIHNIETIYYSKCISKQIFFSDWYAHYKFFWQHQIDWVNEQKQFELFRDKIPLSLLFLVVLVVLGVIIYSTNAINKICSLVA